MPDLSSIPQAAVQGIADRPDAQDQPPEFKAVLRHFWERSGLTAEEIAKQLNINISGIRNWLSGRMPTRDHLDTIAGLERVLNVQPGTLQNLIRFRSRRGHARKGRYDGITDDPHIRARVMRGMSPADMRLPHDDFVRKYHQLAADRLRRNDPVTLAILASRNTDRPEDLPLPQQLDDEIGQYKRLSTITQVDAGADFLPLKRRQDGGAEMEALRMTAVLKHLAYGVAGPRCAVDNLTLGLFLFPKVVQKAVSAKQTKMMGITSEQYLTNVDVAHFTTGKNLVSPPSGLVYQLPELFGPRLRPIDGLVSQTEIDLVARDWHGACERAAKRYSDLRSSFGQFITTSVDRKNSIDGLLDHPDPLFAFEMLNERMAQFFHVCDPESPYWLTVIQNCLIARIESDCAFRDRTLHLLDIDDLRECNDGFKLVVPRRKFKNPNGPYFQLSGDRFRDFERTLSNDNSICEIIETFLSVARPRILRDVGATDSRALFLNACSRPSDSRYEHFPRIGGKSFNSRMKLITQDHLCGEDDGIPGLYPFGTHHCRDILCTGTLKRSNGDLQAAADAIADGISTARKFYARWDGAKREEAVKRGKTKKGHEKSGDVG
jgi:transcriptional regulator with XRE-family HTH domain